MERRIWQAEVMKLAQKDLQERGGRGWKYRSQEHEGQDPQLGKVKPELETTTSV